MNRTLIRLGAALTGLLLSGAALAQSYPSKPVTLLVPYPAGGLSDVIARTVHTALGKNLGQPVIVDNLGGASGSIAAQKVLNSPADGHLIFQGSPNELILAPLAISAVKLKSEDFRLIQMIAIAQIAFLVRKDLPVSNVDEFIAYARRAAADGKPILPSNPPIQIAYMTDNLIQDSDGGWLLASRKFDNWFEGGIPTTNPNLDDK